MRNLLLTFAFMVTGSQAFPAVLYCMPEKVTGFTPEGKTLQVRQFNPERFTAKFEDDMSKVQLSLKRGAWACVKAFAGAIPQFEQILICLPSDLSGYTFQFNDDSKRFLLARTPVTSDVSGGSDTATIEVGTCENF